MNLDIFVIGVVAIAGLCWLTRYFVAVDMRLKGEGHLLGSARRVVASTLILLSGFGTSFATIYFTARLFDLVLFQ